MKRHQAGIGSQEGHQRAQDSRLPGLRPERPRQPTHDPIDFLQPKTLGEMGKALDRRGDHLDPAEAFRQVRPESRTNLEGNEP
jgi:hypothetical protein